MKVGNQCKRQFLLAIISAMLASFQASASASAPAAGSTSSAAQTGPATVTLPLTATGSTSSPTAPAPTTTTASGVKIAPSASAENGIDPSLLGRIRGFLHSQSTTHVITADGKGVPANARLTQIASVGTTTPLRIGGESTVLTPSAAATMVQPTGPVAVSDPAIKAELRVLKKAACGRTLTPKDMRVLGCKTESSDAVQLSGAKQVSLRTGAATKTKSKVEGATATIAALSGPAASAGLTKKQVGKRSEKELDNQDLTISDGIQLIRALGNSKSPLFICENCIQNHPYGTACCKRSKQATLCSLWYC